MKNGDGGKFYLPFFESYYEGAMAIPSKELRCFFYDMLAEYWFDSKEPEFSNLKPEEAVGMRVAFQSIRAVMDKSKYHKENSAKGGGNSKGKSRNKGNNHHAKAKSGGGINSESIVNQ